MNSQTPLGEKGNTSQQHIETEQKTTKISNQSLDHLGKPEQPNEMLEADWLAMSDDWQSQPFDKVDISALLKRTKKRTLWAKSCLGLNIIATLGLLISFIYGLTKGEFSQPMNTYLGLGGLLSAIFVYYEVKIRLTTWQQCCDSPDKAVGNAIAGCQSSLKYILLTKLSFIPFLVLANWFVFAMTQANEKSFWPPLLFINGFMLTMYVITDWFHRKRKKELQQLLSITSK